MSRRDMASARAWVPPRSGSVARFLAVGASGAAVNLVLLAALVRFLAVPPWAASLVAIEASIVWNHHWNRRWTWAARDVVAGSLARYHLVSAGSIALQWGAVVVGTALLGVHYALAAAIGIGLGTVWNYVGHDRLSFGRVRVVERLRASHRPLVYVGAGLLLVAVGAFFTHPWDTFVMQGATHAFLVDGTTPYETAREAPDYIFTGGSLPLVAQWYAYPPLPLLLMSATFWPAAFGFTTSPLVARLLIKLPFLVATLLLGWAAHRFIATAGDGDGDAAALRAERLILLNPLVLVVAAVWGQFEALVLLALIGMFVALRRPRIRTAGALFGAALLVKLLAVYLAPLVAVHVWRRFGRRAAVRFFGATAAVFAVVSLPFFLLEPSGYLHQVVGMHAGRPPARFAPLSALYYATRWGADIGLVPRVPVAELAAALSTVSFLATAIVVVLVAAAAARWPNDEPTLLWTSAATMLAALLTTKVVNEQYLVLPFGLLVLAALHPHSAASPARLPHALRLAGVGSVVVAVVAFVDNLHFLTFFPTDVAEALFGADVGVVSTIFAWSLGSTVLGVRSLLDVVVGVLLGAIFLYAAHALVGPLRAGAAALVGARRLPLRARLVRLPREGAIVPMVLAALIFPMLAVGLQPAAAPPPEALGEDDEALVLALYDTRWNNPSNDPATPVGPWQRARLHPVEGYYSINARRAVDDLSAMREMGADAVLVSYDRFNEYGAYTASLIARETGTPYTLHVDLTRLAPAGQPVALTKDTADAAARLLAGPGLLFWNSGGMLRVGTDRVVFVEGMDELGGALTDAEWRYVTQVAGPAPTPLRPDAADLRRDDALGSALRTMYAAARAAWWADVVRESGVPGDVAFVGDAAVAALPGPRDAWIGQHTAALPADDATLHVFPLGSGALDAGAAARAWGEAARVGADVVVVPWNEHDKGRAVEPTTEHGTSLLQQSALWTRWFREEVMAGGMPGS